LPGEQVRGSQRGNSLPTSANCGSEKRFEGVTMITRLLFIAVLLGLASSVAAEDAFPSRLITLVVAFPPGGVAALSARPTAHVLQKILKEPVIVLNKPGVGGSIGIGWTLTAATTPMRSNPC
jgi:tripartite-type tricarboxylate transporter receptor subunit TctC